MSLSKPVSLIMTVSPVVANQFHNFSQILRLFTEFPIHHLPIVDSTNTLIGMVSSNDLPKVFQQLSAREVKLSLDLDAIDQAINIADIMTRNPITITSDTSILEATKIFADRRFLALPVVDNGVLVGILSAKDILAYIAS